MINFLSKKLCLGDEETPRSSRSLKRLQKMDRSRKSFASKRLQKVNKMSLKSCSSKRSQNVDKNSPRQALVIQDIRDMAVKNGTVKFLVKWQNYPSSGNTWEPLENLQHCEGLIRKCEQRIVRKLNLLYNFEFDGVPEKILDVFRFCGVKVAKVELADSEENKFILFDEVKEKYPQLLLNYYQRTAFNVWDYENCNWGLFNFIVTQFIENECCFPNFFWNLNFCTCDFFKHNEVIIFILAQLEV